MKIISSIHCHKGDLFNIFVLLRVNVKMHCIAITLREQLKDFQRYQDLQQHLEDMYINALSS